MKWSWIFILLTGSLLISTTSGYPEEKALPFSIGEEIQYNVSWEMVKAGKAIFKVLPYTEFNGKTAYHFLLNVNSNRYIDMFYKIRDQHEGFTNIGFTKSLLYKKIQSGKDKKDVTVLFDWITNTATYSNFGGKRDPISIPLNTIDPISAFYKMRALNFEINPDLSFPVTDGKKCFTQKGKVVTKEKITLPSGTFDTYVLVPQVNHFSGVFKKSENPTVKVWITADEKKIPVRIKVKVFIGSVIFELVSMNLLNYPE